MHLAWTEASVRRSFRSLARLYCWKLLALIHQVHVNNGLYSRLLVPLYMLLAITFWIFLMEYKWNLFLNLHMFSRPQLWATKWTWRPWRKPTCHPSSSEKWCGRLSVVPLLFPSHRRLPLPVRTSQAAFSEGQQSPWSKSSVSWVIVAIQPNHNRCNYDTGLTSSEWSCSDWSSSSLSCSDWSCSDWSSSLTYLLV